MLTGKRGEIQLNKAAVVPVPGAPLQEVQATLAALGKFEMGTTIPRGTNGEASPRAGFSQAVTPRQPRGKDAAQLPSLHTGSTTQSHERFAQKAVNQRRFGPGFQPSNPMNIQLLCPCCQFSRKEPEVPRTTLWEECDAVRSGNITKTGSTGEFAASPTALLTRQQGSWTAEKGSSLRFFSQKMNLYMFQITSVQLQLLFCKDRIRQIINSIHSTNRTVNTELSCSTLTPLTKGKTTSVLRLLGLLEGRVRRTCNGSWYTLVSNENGA